MILKGFLLGLGFILGLITFIAVIIVIVGSAMIIQLRTRYVSTNIMQQYLTDLTDLQYFEEAEEIRQLLIVNKGQQKIKLPDRYKIEVKLSTSDDHPIPFSFRRSITITRKEAKDQQNKDSTEAA